MDYYQTAAITAIGLGLLAFIMLFSSFFNNTFNNTLDSMDEFMQMLENLSYTEEIIEVELVHHAYIEETSRQESSSDLTVMPIYNGTGFQTMVYPTSTTKTKRVPEEYRVVVFHDGEYVEINNKNIHYHVIQNNIEPGSKLELIYETGRNEEDEIIISGFTRVKED